jgi:hypothetical protein
MDTAIKCPHCGTEIQLSDAFRKEMEAEILGAVRERHERELAAARASAEEAANKKAECDFAAREP